MSNIALAAGVANEFAIITVEAFGVEYEYAKPKIKFFPFPALIPISPELSIFKKPAEFGCPIVA